MSEVTLNKSNPRGVKPHGGRSSFLPASVQRMLIRNREGIVGYSLLSPMIVYFIIFSLFPIFFVIYLAFTEWNGITGFPKWIGWQNFHKFFTADDYFITLVRAGFYGFCILFFNIIIGFFMALLLNQKIFAVGVIRTIWYLPALVSFAVVSQMAVAILNPVDGLVKRMMVSFGMEPIIFQQSAIWMSFWLILITVWKGVGGTVIIYLAGLQGIDPTLYEAARVDGASKFRLVWHITLPSIRPITMYITIVGIIASFQIFEPVNLITHGGPTGQTNIILYRIYQDAFQNFSMGMASASSVMVLVVSMLFTIFQYRISQRSNT
jgi:multiple sugar transport system permease protein